MQPPTRRRRKGLLILGFALAAGTVKAAPPPAPDGGRALTIYNQDFAVVRTTIPLNLTAGVNHVVFRDITDYLEPASVVLRDPSGLRTFQILEQNYRADPLSQELLLSHYEGQTLDFQVQHGDHMEIVRGKVVRSGYVPHRVLLDYGQVYFQGQQYSGNAVGTGQPLIEVNGKLQFALPGLPLFPPLTDDDILKPTLEWTIQSARTGPLAAELAYVTGGMSWKADYNVVAPKQGNDLELVGWVTMDNHSGQTFQNARIKLMAGNVGKVQPNPNLAFAGAFDGGRISPAVTEKPFDDYHLYTLQHTTTLRNQETKQVEFVRAPGIHSRVVYVYDGVSIDPNQYNGWSYDNIRNQSSYGTQWNPQVSVMREIINSQKNGLGIPLPQGRVRFYRKDADEQLEFIGENQIGHTPKDETLRINTGTAFDLIGERRQTSYKIDNSSNQLDESFTLKIRNHKAEPVEVQIVEHLYRGLNWSIPVHSNTYLKTDAHTIEFRVEVPPNGEKAVTYTTHYTW